ncbi:aminotransferase class III-fold pyridoxal phosphate-dependent enzyme [Demequina salsinemoris]|uniref:aminotransferase class III-fold pyridoxal phosphate-dependent enzyme n=1 Tax=Demequina salsinemoris TaxID=577470 RepID=UPI000784FE5B|nr:aminotransferase class III-fold pyridoxal phosphate-dependent enzyme [Demequina salsinemoris]
MTATAEQLAHLSPALARSTDVVAVAGEGPYLIAEDGTRYLDWVQGIAVNALGHSHPRVVAAIQEQAARLVTASFNVVTYPATVELADRIAFLAPGDLGSVFFSNGGAEAIDGAIKLARVATGRPAIISFLGSFHGRTLGATSVTASSAKYRSHYEPLLGGVHFAPYPSRGMYPGLDDEEIADRALADLQRLFDHVVLPETVAAILIEPLQGEGGYWVPPRRYMQELRALCDKHGILLISDEIQAGYGRTGEMFAMTQHGVVPDIMTLGKAMGGGLPMSAIVSTPELMARWKPGLHGTTFGGNPLAAAAALAVLDEFAASDVLGNVRTQGAYLAGRLADLKERHASIADVRGLGLMAAIQLDHADGTPGGDLVDAVRRAALERGLLVLSCGVKGNAIRIATPLNVTAPVLDEGLAILEECLDIIEGGAA